MINSSGLGDGPKPFYVQINGVIIPNPENKDSFCAAIDGGYDSIDLQRYWREAWDSTQDTTKAYAYVKARSDLFSRLSRAGVSDPVGLCKLIKQGARVNFVVPKGSSPQTDLKDVPSEFMNAGKTQSEFDASKNVGQGSSNSNVKGGNVMNGGANGGSNEDTSLPKTFIDRLTERAVNVMGVDIPIVLIVLVIGGWLYFSNSGDGERRRNPRVRRSKGYSRRKKARKPVSRYDEAYDSGDDNEEIGLDSDGDEEGIIDAEYEEV